MQNLKAIRHCDNRHDSITQTRAYGRSAAQAAGMLAGLLFAVAGCVPSLAQSNTSRHFHLTPPEVLDGRATLVDHYTPSNMLRLAIVLTPPHMTEERQFLDDLQNKQSPLFHQYLSAADWDARFAPSVEDEQAVVDWARSQGLTITHRYDDRLVVDIEAPAGTIEKALSVTLNHYRLPAEGNDEARIVFSNDRDPVLPSRLSEVVESVHGLSSILVRRPGSGRVVPQPDYTPGPAVKDAGTLQKDATTGEATAASGELESKGGVTPPPAGYYTPSDMWSSDAYDYRALMNQKHCCNPLNNSSGHSPRESSIAIGAFGDVSFTDVNNFQSAFSYLATYVDKISIDGGYTCNYAKGDDGCSEVTLDTEWSLSMANSEGAASDTARVVVYEAPNTGAAAIDMFNQMVTDAHARTMSTSWSFPDESGNDAQMQAEDNIFSKMAGQGWTLVGDAGDQGATGACSDALLVRFPASDPNVVAAGGTELSEGSPYEVAWTGGTKAGSCANNGGGGTGGISSYFNPPSYQAYLGHSKRAVPDLSLDAYYGHDTYYQGKWLTVGGTSVVAPMLGGFFAQANAYLLAIGNKCGTGTAPCAPLGNANYPIYREDQFKNTAHFPFYDTLVGCNSNDITVKYGLTARCAHAGYDLATGLGSANMLQLSWAINWYTAAASGYPNVSYKGPATGKWYNSQQTVSWKVNDYAGGKTGILGTGIAGHTQGWDSIPSDPGSEAHGGTGNSFYSGPQYINDSGGCLSLKSGGSCSGGVSQGCHTVHVRGWNNQGMTTGNTRYGPICYDSVAPSTSLTTAITTGVAGIKVTLTASDPGTSNKTGSGVYRTYYSVDNSACTTSATSKCSVYNGPFTITVTTSTHTVRYFSKDNAGNVESEHSKTVTVANN